MKCKNCGHELEQAIGNVGKREIRIWLHENGNDYGECECGCTKPEPEKGAGKK